MVRGNAVNLFESHSPGPHVQGRKGKLHLHHQTFFLKSATRICSRTCPIQHLHAAVKDIKTTCSILGDYCINFMNVICTCIVVG